MTSPATNSSSDFPILTPVTYLNYLNPQDVKVYEVSRNIFLAVVGAAIMELLESIPADIRIFRLGINPTVIAYALSRPAAILFGLLAILAKSPNTMDCQKLELAEFTCCFVAMTTSSFLFLRRVQAVWINNRIISIVFSLIWLTGVAFDALLFDVTKAGPLADTGYCIIASIKGPWGAGAPIVALAFDTLVFLCISYKLATEYRFHDNGAVVTITWDTIMSGRALPKLAQSVLRGGQQYYLIAVIANLFLVVFMAFPLTSLELAVAPTPVAIIIISTSACRVFRDLRLSAIRSSQILDNSRSMKFDLPTHNLRGGNSAARETVASTFLSNSTNPTTTATVDHTIDNSGIGSTVIALEHVDTSSDRKVVNSA